MNSNPDSLDESARPRESAAVLESPKTPNPPRPSAVPHHDASARGPRIGLLLFLALVLVVGALVFGLLPRLKQRAEVRSDTRELAVQTVSVVSPGPAKVGPPLVLSGELKPEVEAVIYARATGYVRRWLVDIGAHVEKGQLLAELDSPELEREHAQAAAEVAQAESALALAQSTAKRWKEMLSGKTVSTQEADEKFGDVKVKEATVAAAHAKEQRLTNLLDFTKITAPFSGTITARSIDVGQLVTEGSGIELFRLAQTAKLRVFARVPQSYSRAVVVGQTAAVTVPEMPGRKIEGKILRTAGAMDAASRTLLVEIEVDNAKGDLLAGSYARVRLTDAQPDSALTLPSGTVLFRTEGPQVAVVEDGHTKMRSVSLGRDFGAIVEIVGGLTAQDRVIVNPPDSLVDGVEVRVQERPQ